MILVTWVVNVVLPPVPVPEGGFGKASALNTEEGWKSDSMTQITRYPTATLPRPNSFRFRVKERTNMIAAMKERTRKVSM